MSICGIESLVYGVEDLALCTRFFTDWGLELAEKGAHGADFRLPDGGTIHLRMRDDPSLPPAPVPGSTLRLAVWGVETDDELASLAAELTRDREVTQSDDGTLVTMDDSGYAVGLRRTARHLEPAAFAPFNSVGRIGRIDARAEAAFPYRVHPRRMVHLVYWIPRDLERARRFYEERLGFRLTESVTGVGHFLRCAPASDHHNLFLQQRGRNYGFQHVAFEVRDIDEVMMAGQYMERQGWKTHLGPGRHVVGSNVYWYVYCPAGGVVEIGCDLDYITDHWQPMEHPSMPAGGSSWFVRREDEGLRPGHGDWPQYEAVEIEGSG